MAQIYVVSFRSPSHSILHIDILNLQRGSPVDSGYHKFLALMYFLKIFFKRIPPPMLRLNHPQPIILTLLLLFTAIRTTLMQIVLWYTGGPILCDLVEMRPID